jgi:hypothetical protein
MSPVKTLSDPFEDYVSYLRNSHTLVEQVYRLEKQQNFVSAGSPESDLGTLVRTLWMLVLPCTL